MTIEVSKDKDITVIELARPDVLNAISFAMAEELMQALDQAEVDDSIAVVLTGQGQAFSSGSDLREQDVDFPAKIRLMHRIIWRLVKFPKLTVAAINGVALGGGLELTLGCALRVAHPGAELGLPEIKISVMPCYGATQLLPQLIGEARALSMMLTGDAIDAREALAIGLVTALDEQPLVKAVTLARECASGRQHAQQAIRRAVFEGGRRDLNDGLELERELVDELLGDEEIHKVVAAFFVRK